VTDSEHGFIEQVHVTSANISEVKELPRVIEGIEMKCLYADKGYASADNREMLKRLGVEDGIMHKAVRNRALTDEEKIHNRAISKRRFVVERCFGTLKRQFKFTRASYCSRLKGEGQMILKAIAYNLLKAFYLGKYQVKYV